MTIYGDTPDKNTASYQVTGLLPGTPYYFRLCTFTPAHGEQQNELWSEYTEPVAATPH